MTKQLLIIIAGPRCIIKTTSGKRLAEELYFPIHQQRGMLQYPETELKKEGVSVIPQPAINTEVSILRETERVKGFYNRPYFAKEREKKC